MKIAAFLALTTTALLGRVQAASLRNGTEPAVVAQDSAAEVAHAGQTVNEYGPICYHYPDYCILDVNGKVGLKETVRAVLDVAAAVPQGRAATESANADQNSKIYGPICYRYPDYCYIGVNGSPVPKAAVGAVLELASAAAVTRGATESITADQNAKIYGPICYRYPDYCYIGVNGSPVPKDFVRAILDVK